MNLSVVIPLLDEEASLEELYTWIAKVMQSNQYQYELFFIDDGSADRSWEVITKLAAADANVKGIRFRKNYGKSQALNAGFKAVSGEVVITMEDAPLKPDPAPVRRALEALGARRAWMIGDTPDDVRAARAAGVLPVGVIAPGSPIPSTTETLLGAGAAVVLDRWDQLQERLP